MSISKLQRILQSPLLRNFSVLTGSTMISYLMSFFVVMHVARVLGPEEYGKVGFAQAFVSYFMLIASMGLETLGVRDIARDKSNCSVVLTNITLLRLALFFVAYGVMATALYLFPRDPVSNYVVFVFGAYMLLTPVHQEWYYMGNENFKIVGISRIVHSLLYCALVFIFIRSKGQVVEFTALQVGANLIPLAVLWLPVFRQVKIKHFDLRLVRTYLRSGVWLMLSSFMTAVYWNMDKVMIGYLLPDEYLGWYDAAYKIIFLLIVPSIMLWGVMGPRIARRERRDIWLSVGLLIIGGGLLALCAIPSRELLIRVVFGEQYAPAAAPLGILALALFANHCSRAFSSPLQLWGREKVFFIAAMAGAVVNIALNMLLIPRYELVGAAWATVAADVAVTLCSLPFFLREMWRKSPDE
jgi:O-antigen/teichoic acid export membrane protein